VIHRGLIGAAAMLAVLAGAVWSVETWAAKDAEGAAAYRETRQVRPLSTRPPSGEAKREMEERIAKYLGISREEVAALVDQGVKHCDLFPAAAIAKLSNRDLRAVLEEKTEQKTWRSVAEDLGVDAEQFRREVHRILPAAARKGIWLDHHPEVVSKSIAEYLKMDEKKLEAMIKKEKVRPREWLKAAVLSKISGKPLGKVMAMKKKSSWLEVATDLGVSREEIRTEMKRLRKILKKHANRWDEEHRETGRETGQIPSHRLSENLLGRVPA
jgi:biotin operon repressor